MKIIELIHVAAFGNKANHRSKKNSKRVSLEVGWKR
jgi:hypothetical protein